MPDRHPLFDELQSMDLPAEWVEAENTSLAKARSTIVLGAPDSGKSTFALWLAQQAVLRGERVAYIDSDMGQSHVGPPTTIGMEFFSDGQAGRETSLFFVGATNPKQHLLQTLSGVRMMKDKARAMGADRVIVDTTGLVHGGAARELKLQKINLLQPDCVVALQRGEEIEHLLAPHRHRQGVQSVRLSVSSQAKARKREVRKSYRSDKFQSYLAGAARLDFPLGQAWMHGRNFCSGRPLSGKECAELSRILGAKLVFGNRLFDELFVITNTVQSEELLEKARKHFGVAFIFHMPIGAFRNLVVGLIDGSGFAVGIGLFFYLNLQEKMASIYTPCRSTQGIEMIQLGSLHVNPAGKELDIR